MGLDAAKHPPREDAPLWKTLQRTLLSYHPGTYGGKVVLFLIEDWEIYSGFRFAPDSLYGWGDLVQGGLDVIRVPGDHFSMMNEPSIHYLAERFAECLEKAKEAGR